MASTVEDRLANLEARLAEVEQTVAQTHRRRIGLTIEEAKARLQSPPNYGPEQIELFRRICGSFDGPEDLSERMRDYLYGEHE